MAKKKNKFYVVWQGKTPGIFDSWDECKKQIEGFKDTKYMGFRTLEEAKIAFERGFENYYGKKGKKDVYTEEDIKKYGKPVGEAIAVDAAFNGKTQMLEYKGVFVETSTELFHFGPIKGGSNNVGEFLAIVHALAYETQNKLNYQIYTDSKIAMAWIKQKKCKTNSDLSKYPKLFDIVRRAEKWLAEHPLVNIEIKKWHTNAWGEIPADFGRK